MRTEPRKSVNRAAIPSWKRRPGVMTARCHLELATLALVVGDIGIKAPPGETDSWEAYSDRQLELFTEYYERAHTDESVRFDDEHVRELVQLRLHAALLDPGWKIAPVTAGAAPDCLKSATPERDHLAHWLRDHGHNANVVLSISAPEYLAWMQIMSGDDGLLDWIADPAQDPLRRDAVQHKRADGTKYRAVNARDRERVLAGVERAKRLVELRRAAAG